MGRMIWWSILAILSIFTLAACGDDSKDSTTDGDEAVDGDGEESPEDGDTPADGDGGGDDLVTRITGAGTLPEAGAGQYKILVAWTDTNNGTGLFTLGGSEETPTALRAGKAVRRTRESVRPEWMSAERYESLTRKLEFDRRMRETENELARTGRVNTEMFVSFKAAKPSSECGETEVARDGACTSELDLTFPTDGAAFTATVLGKGTHVAVAQDDADVVPLTAEQISAVISRFDGLIYPRDQFLFGGSVVNEIDYTDRDQDGMHLILFTDKVTSLGMVGFFNSSDFLAKGTNNSNQSDLLWIATPNEEISLDSAFGTIAHEYYHMMMFGVKKVKFGAAETLFLDESLAHLTEDASGFGIDNLDVVASYLSSSNNTSWAFSDPPDSIEARGMGFLFLRYLFELKGGIDYSATEGSELTDQGGAAFLTSLLHTNLTGFDALEAALAGEGGWKPLFVDFLAAVVLDDLPVAEGSPYGYGPLYDDPLTGQKIGVCTNCTRQSGMGGDLEMTGLQCDEVSEVPYDGVISSTGVQCLTLPAGGALNAATEETEMVFGRVKVGE